MNAINPMFYWVEFENVCIENDLKSYLSPLVAKVTIQMLRRWAYSYLMPNVALYAQINCNFLGSLGSGAQHALQMLDFLVNKCAINLFGWLDEVCVFCMSFFFFLIVFGFVHCVCNFFKKK